MTHVKNINGNIVIDSTTGHVINNVYHGKLVTDDEWIELTTVAVKYGKDDEVRRLRQVESLIKEGKGHEAGHIWAGIRNFFVSALPHAANIAQIVGTVDQLIRSS